MPGRRCRRRTDGNETSGASGLRCTGNASLPQALCPPQTPHRIRRTDSAAFRCIRGASLAASDLVPPLLSGGRRTHTAHQITAGPGCSPRRYRDPAGSHPRRFLRESWPVVGGGDGKRSTNPAQRSTTRLAVSFATARPRNLGIEDRVDPILHWEKRCAMCCTTVSARPATASAPDTVTSMTIAP